ncbi:MAG: outer membrane protein transport protein [Bacteroidales bacterium]|nr:outer membrane protein transport protein [Bacteroidales bacterium]
MKKLTFTVLSLLVTISLVNAGGIVTNTNQSASWVRMMVREASTSIDAVYFNPAGLTKLPDGFHLSLNNQYITENRKVISNYTYLNDGEYKGEASAPIFPGIYAAYKTGGLVFSAGFNVIGGGGSATYDRGLPSFELPPSDLVPGLQAAGQPVTAYSLNTFFEGKSFYLGFQAGVSIELSEQFSFYVGGRYVTANNTYNGYLKDIMITLGGTDMRADAFFTGAAAQATAGAASATGAATGMQLLIDGGAGGLTFAQAEGAGIIDAAKRAVLEGGLTALGIDPTGMTIAVAQGAYTGAAASLTTIAAESTAKATLLADQEADVKQTGSGITPIFGINFSPSDKLNIGFRYEHQTNITLENETKKDVITGFTTTGTPITMFPDGGETDADLPAMISLGASYEVTSNLNASVGVLYYFDKSASYGRTKDGLSVSNDEVIDKNFYEIALGLEYGLTDQLLVSGGYLFSKTGVSEEYQSDLSYSLSSHVFGLGGKYKFSEMMSLNLGGGYAMYADSDKNFSHDLGGTPVLVKETYSKGNLFIGVGIDFSF